MLPSIAHPHWKLSVLMSLLFLVPGAALAAEPESPTAERIPGTEAPAPLRLVEEDLRKEPVQYSHPIVRVGAGIAAETVTSLAMGITGAIGGFLLCDALKLDQAGGFFPCGAEAGYGFLTGVALGAPLGVYWGSKIAGGQGTLRGAFVGTTVAATAGAIVTLFVYNDDIKPFFIPTFSLLGAIIGYEVSHYTQTAARSAPTASIQPVLGISENGGALGMAGRF